MSATCPSCGYHLDAAAATTRQDLWSNIDEVVLLREEGWTLAAIGEKFGFSRERVRQLVARYQAETGREVIAPQRETVAERTARRRAERRAQVETEREQFAAAWIGQRFGSWTVTDMSRDRGYSGGPTWRAVVHCDCGVVSKVWLHNLVRASSTTCGSKVHGYRLGWYRRTAPDNVLHIPEGHP